MLSLLIQIVVTAMLAALTTWALAFWYFRRYLHAELQRMELEIAEQVEERVRRGAIQAGEELLPAFRSEVTRGFKDALLGIPRGELVEEAAKSMAERGAEVVGVGLSTIFGQKRPRGSR